MIFPFERHLQYFSPACPVLRRLTCAAVLPQRWWVQKRWYLKAFLLYLDTNPCDPYVVHSSGLIENQGAQNLDVWKRNEDGIIHLAFKVHKI